MFMGTIMIWGHLLGGMQWPWFQPASPAPGSNAGMNEEAQNLVLNSLQCKLPLYT